MNWWINSCTKPWRTNKFWQQVVWWSITGLLLIVLLFFSFFLFSSATWMVHNARHIHGSFPLYNSLIKINQRTTPKQLVHGFANTIIIEYYLHLKIYLLNNRVRNIAIIPLDIHIICKYSFLYVSHLEKVQFTSLFVRWVRTYM